MRATWGLGAAVLLFSVTGFAASSSDLPPPPPPPPPPPAQAQCFPACRSGYFCHQGQCVSACNPPCGRGEVCSGGQCLVNGEVPPPPPPPGVEDDRRRDEGDGPPPPGFHYESRRRIGMLIGGLVPLGAGYFFSVLYGLYSLATPAATGYYHGTGNLLYFVPVLGPLMRLVYGLGDRPLSGYYGVGVDLLLTLVFTAAQAVGLTFTLIGAFKKSQVLVRDGESARSSDDGGWRLSLAPMLAIGGGGGLTLVLEH